VVLTPYRVGRVVLICLLAVVGGCSAFIALTHAAGSIPFDTSDSGQRLRAESIPYLKYGILGFGTASSGIVVCAAGRKWKGSFYIGLLLLLLTPSLWLIGSRESVASQYAQPTGKVSSLDALSCPDLEHCWAIGTDQAAPDLGVPPVVLASSNGGSTWHAEALPNSSQGTSLGGISCANDLHCMVIGGSDIFGGLSTYGTPAIAFETSNGGSTWRPMTLPPKTPGLDAISCVTATDCVATGGVITLSQNLNTAPDEMQSEEGVALVTHDGGRSWTSVSGPVIPFTSASAINAAQCPSSQLCWGLDDGTIEPISSEDGGRSWTLDAQFPVQGVREIKAFSCPTSTQCWFFVEGVGETYVLDMKTNGSSWSFSVQDVSTQRAAWTAASCTQNDACTAADNNGVTAETSLNGGVAWTSSAVPGGYAITAISCFGIGHCVALANLSNGNTIFDSSFAALSTVDGGLTWTIHGIQAGR
jgi:hypothetical protein